MRILSFKPGHDGTTALIEDGRLVFSHEAEKGSFPRYGELSPTAVLDAMARMDGPPDVVCLSGWVKGFHSTEPPLGAGYFGFDGSETLVGESRMLGHRVRTFSSTHERSHLLSAYGMSDIEHGSPCYALVWEGNIGSFYEFTPDVRIRRVRAVLEDPGNKYQHIFALADPSSPPQHGGFRFSNAGKMMALTGFARSSPVSRAEGELIEYILDQPSILLTAPKEKLAWSPFHDIGVESQEFKDLAAKHSKAIFERFLTVAEQELTRGLPLLIAGGCGLNCDWNRQWRDCGLFPEVFVPPCPNDSGSAIGTAIDAQLHFTGQSKIAWNVYSGPEFLHDRTREQIRDSFDEHALDLLQVAELLASGRVLAWVQGNCEIGPRALGNRSLLAAPFEPRMRDQLNRIKLREPYRPIAPVCREEDVSDHFDWDGPSPYMLYFQHVRDQRLQAVTHVDGTARAQTVNAGENPRLHGLLGAFKQLTGAGVLCNTSLNLPGRGFINSTSDLIAYVLDRRIDGFVLEDRLYVTQRGPLALTGNEDGTA
ncbi:MULTISPECIES: carbamoyltransferase C-terminal domain-containing protein [Streptomyces]|uniref:carbamoyltransferase C-terminal domain-containing protein n=1 Tax=Streptomyces TaxID=1883 RepID=UPI0004BDA561|nr:MULTISPECIES: carbamoyltransferase C-terminal domain-containing protein [Streptomyces]